MTDGVSATNPEPTTLEQLRATVAAWEDRLQTLEENWSSLVTNSRAIVVLLDLDGTIRFVNLAKPPFIRSEVIGRRAEEFVPPGYHALVRQVQDRVQRSGQGENLQIPGPPREGRPTWYDVQVVPVDREGRVIRLLCIATEITEHKNAQLALQESERRYRTLIEEIDDVIYVVDDRGCLTFLSPQATRYGFEPDRMIGHEFLEFVMPEDRAPLLAQFRESLASGQAKPTAFRIDCPKGGVRWFDERGRAQLDEAGRTAGFIGILRDVTDRRRAEDALRDSEARYRLLVETTPDGVGVAINGRVAFLNAAGCRLLGVRALREIVGRPILEFVHPNSRDTAGQRIQRLIERRLAVPPMPEKFVRLDGREFDVEMTATPVSYQGSPAIQVIFRDITERLRLERALAEVSEREQRRIGHDLHDSLGQHLAGLAFLSEALHQELRDTGSASAGQAEEIARLASQAITEAKNLARHLAPVDLSGGRLTAALTELAQETRRLYEVDCSCEVPPDLHVENEATAAHLYRIAQEAVNNAVRHGQARRVRIGLSTGDGSITLEVHDNGTGFREPAATHRGMGMIIMQQRARSLGGTVQIRSQPGKGTALVCQVPPLPPSVSARGA